MAQAVEIRWWRRYLGRREAQGYLAWKRRYWLTFLRRTGLRVEDLTGLPDGGDWASPFATEEGKRSRPRVLDAGCGPAGIFLVLDRCEVDAVDPLLERYRVLPHFRPESTPWVSWYAQPLESFHREGDYDLIFCLNVINHVRDVGSVLAVLAKAVKPAGTVILSVDAHRHTWLKTMFRAVPGDVLHPHQYNLDEYRRLCTEAGFECVTEQLYHREAIFDYVVFTLTPRS